MAGDHSVLKKQRFLLHRVLAAEDSKLATLGGGKTVTLNDGVHYHFTCDSAGKLVSTPSFTAREDGGDWLLIEVPFDAKHLAAFGSNIADRHRGAVTALVDSQLSPGFDYELMLGYHDNSAEGKKPWQLPPPDYFYMAINAAAFGILATEILKTLANPETGMKLLGYSDREKYLHSFGYENSIPSALAHSIVTHARLTSDEVKIIKDMAIQHNNFEFCKPLDMALGNRFTGMIDNQRIRGSGQGHGDSVVPSFDF